MATQLTQKRKRYTVQVKINLMLDHEVLAVDLADALAQGKALAVTDVIEHPGSGYNDGEIEVWGVYGP